MASRKRLVPIIQSILIIPAAVFMLALISRSLGATGAARVVDWYSGRLWTLWLLLSLFPFAVFVIGFFSLWSEWRGESRPLLKPVIVVIAGLTLIAAIILAIVGIHVLVN